MRAVQPASGAFPELTSTSTALAVRNQDDTDTSTGSTTPRSVYEAGAMTRRTATWRAPSSSPNTSMLMSLGTIRDRSRQAIRNDGFAKGAIDELVSNLIGTGIQPLSKADDATFRSQVQALWLRWTDESDADGQLDWYGQQTQAARAWLEAGEVFIRLRDRLPTDGLSVPLQLQVIEPELCPHSLFTTTPGGNKVRAGKEFDAIGRVVAYWFYPSRTNDADEIDYGTLKRIPADKIQHVYDPLRAGQLRGLPVLTQTLVRLHHLDKFDDATLLGQELKNLFVGFVRSPMSDAGGAGINPLTGLPVDGTDRPFATLEPGIFQELAPGEEVEWSNPPQVPQTYPDFMRQQLMAAGTACGVPYELWTGDMRGVNDRVMRVVLQKFRRRIQSLQHQIIAFKLCRPIWNAWLDRAYISGALPMVGYGKNPEPWQRAKWMPQGWPYLNPVQDIQSLKEGIRAGLTSRSSVVSEQGEDAEVIDAEQIADNTRADEGGLRYDSDGRHPDGGPKNAVAASPDAEPSSSSTQQGAYA